MLTPSHYMRAYTDAQLDAIIGDPRHYGVGERLDADNLRRERRGDYRARAAELATMDATRRAIIGAAPVAPPCPECGAIDEYVGGLCYSCGHGSDPCPECEHERDAGRCYSCGIARAGLAVSII